MDNLKDKKVTVYGLITDLDENIRYVGQTTRCVIKRLRQHISKSRTAKTHKDYWLNKRSNQNVGINIVILDENAIWDETEKYWIKRLRDGGCKLTNSTDGGEGTLGHKHSDEFVLSKSHRHLLMDGRELTLKEMSLISGLTSDNIWGRLNKGYSPDEAIQKIPKSFNKVTYKGVCYTIRDAATKFNMSYDLLRKRLYAGWDHNRAIEQSPPTGENKHLISTGEYLTANQISNITGVPSQTIRCRVREGFSPEKLTSPLKRYKTVDIDGEMLTVKQISEKTGIPVQTINHRINKSNLSEDITRLTEKKHLIGTGEFLTVNEIVQLTGISKGTIKSRIQRGFTPEKLISPLDMKYKAKNT